MFLLAKQMKLAMNLIERRRGEISHYWWCKNFILPTWLIVVLYFLKAYVYIVGCNQKTKIREDQWEEDVHARWSSL